MRGRLTWIASICALLLLCAGCTTDGESEATPSPQRTRVGLSEIEKRDDRPKCRNLDALVERIQRGYYPFRSPDISFIPREPNYVGSAENPVHSGPWDYLTHVPGVLYGPGHIVPGTYDSDATMADLAPTTAALVGYDDWPARDGRVLEEALDPGAGRPPKLVLSIVWDGGGWNTLEAHPERWPYLEQLIDKSANLTNFNVGSSPSVTPPIHATLGTGSFPSRHGISGLKVRSETYEQVNPLGTKDGELLEVTTLADEYDRALDNEPVTGMFGSTWWHLAMIGHGSDLPGADSDPVALLDRATSEIKSNTEVYSQPELDDPAQLQAFAERLDIQDGARDEKWRGHPLDTPVDLHVTPAIVDYEQWLIQRMIADEGFGADDVPDLLYINFKTADVAFHKYGMNSPEVGAALRAQDNNLRRMVRFLDREVGRNEWVLMLTADHGQTPYPEESGAWPIFGGQIMEDLNAVFDKTDDGVPLVRKVGSAGIFVQLDQLEANDAKLWKMARWVAGYTIGENRPKGPEDRRDELLFDAVFAKRRLAAVACDRD